jgi:hypothetical protein
MDIYGDNFEKSIVTVNIPHCEKALDCAQILFPASLDHARYLTYELAENLLANKRYYILGEWTQNDEGWTHYNYGPIDTQNTSVAKMAAELVC